MGVLYLLLFVVFMNCLLKFLGEYLEFIVNLSLITSSYGWSEFNIFECGSF